MAEDADDMERGDVPELISKILDFESRLGGIVEDYKLAIRKRNAAVLDAALGHPLGVDGVASDLGGISPAEVAETASRSICVRVEDILTKVGVNSRLFVVTPKSDDVYAVLSLSDWYMSQGLGRTAMANAIIQALRGAGISARASGGKSAVPHAELAGGGLVQVRVPRTQPVERTPGADYAVLASDDWKN